VVGAVSRGTEGAARRARSPGCRVRRVVLRRGGGGPRRRRTLEGASTTSHA